MSSRSAPIPLVIDSTFPKRTNLPYKTVVLSKDDIGIVLSRSDASSLAIALHEFDRAGAVLAPQLKLLRDELDKTLTSRAAPPLEGKALLAARRARRDLLWKMLAEEDRNLAAGAAIQADLHPTPERASAAGLEEEMRRAATAPTVNPAVIEALREDWQC